MILTVGTYERSINWFIEFRKKADDLLQELDQWEFFEKTDRTEFNTKNNS